MQMLPSTPGPPGVSGLSFFVSLCSRTGHGTHAGTYKAWSLVFFLCLHFFVFAFYYYMYHSICTGHGVRTGAYVAGRTR